MYFCSRVCVQFDQFWLIILQYSRDNITGTGNTRTPPDNLYNIYRVGNVAYPTHGTSIKMSKSLDAQGLLGGEIHSEFDGVVGKGNEKQPLSVR